jgi:hypothetical protein
MFLFKFLTVITLFLPLQSGIIRALKGGSKVPKNIIRSSGKVASETKSLNRASAMLLTSETVIAGKTNIADDLVAAGAHTDDLSGIGKGVGEAGATVAKTVKKTSKAGDALGKLTNELIEDALEDLIFQSIHNRGTTFDNSMRELMNEPKFSEVVTYFIKQHGFKIERKIDLFLLLNEKDVDGFKIEKKEVSRIMVLYSEVFTGRAISALILDLSEYQPVVDRLKAYAVKRKIMLPKN